LCILSTGSNGIAVAQAGVSASLRMLYLDASRRRYNRSRGMGFCQLLLELGPEFDSAAADAASVSLSLGASAR